MFSSSLWGSQKKKPQSHQLISSRNHSWSSTHQTGHNNAHQVQTASSSSRFSLPRLSGLSNSSQTVKTVTPTGRIHNSLSSQQRPASNMSTSSANQISSLDAKNSNELSEAPNSLDLFRNLLNMIQGDEYKSSVTPNLFNNSSISTSSYHQQKQNMGILRELEIAEAARKVQEIASERLARGESSSMRVEEAMSQQTANSSNFQSSGTAVGTVVVSPDEKWGMNPNFSDDEEDTAMAVEEEIDTHNPDAHRIERLLQMRMRDIDQDEYASARSCVNGPSTPEVMIEKFSIDMTRAKIVCLRQGTWLNDEVVNFYMQLLNDRDTLLCKKFPDGRRSSFCFNSFFINKLLNGKSGYDYKEVKRWTKKFDALEKEKLIFPINISNSHWTLAVVYMQRKRIVYYDSMSGSGKTYLQGLLRWVVDEAMAKKNITVDPTEWTTERANGIPQQQNGFDCGAFACMFADLVSDDLPLVGSFSQSDMPMNRIKIAASILRGALPYEID